MRKILFALLLLSVTYMTAQDMTTVPEEENIGSMVLRFEDVECTDPVLVAKSDTLAEAKANMDAYCEYARDVIWAAAKASKRFIITDLEAAKQYDEELKGIFGAQMDEEKRAKLIESNANKIMASDWVMDAQLTQVKVNIRTYRGGARGYSAQVALVINIKDREDANLKTVESFTVSTTPVPMTQQKFSAKRREAVTKAISDLRWAISRNFEGRFPIRAKGLGMENGLYKISAGSKQGLKEKQELIIMHKAYDEAEKKYIETPIGTCKIKEIYQNSSLCELPKKINEMMGEYAVKPGIIYVTDK